MVALWNKMNSTRRWFSEAFVDTQTKFLATKDMFVGNCAMLSHPAGWYSPILYRVNTDQKTEKTTVSAAKWQCTNK